MLEMPKPRTFMQPSRSCYPLTACTHCTDAYNKSKVHPITGHEGPEVAYRYSYTLSLTLALDGVGGQRHALAALPPGQSRYPFIGAWVGPRAVLDRCEKSPHRPARSESLYRLRYPAPRCT